MTAANACPVQFSIPELDNGYTYVQIDFAQESEEFEVANYLANDFFDLLERLYRMNPKFHRDQPELTSDCPRDLLKHDGETNSYTLDWDLRGYYVYVTLRAIGTIPDGNVELKVTIDDSPWIKTTVTYKQLCYTIVKAVNDLMARQGFLGICWTNQKQDLNLQYFLRLKTFAMDLECSDQFNGLTSDSKLEDDLKLLAMPMP